MTITIPEVTIRPRRQEDRDEARGIADEYLSAHGAALDQLAGEGAVPSSSEQSGAERPPSYSMEVGEPTVLHGGAHFVEPGWSLPPRVAEVEARLQRGDAAGVTSDAERDMRGTPEPAAQPAAQPTARPMALAPAPDEPVLSAPSAPSQQARAGIENTAASTRGGDTRASEMLKLMQRGGPSSADSLDVPSRDAVNRARNADRAARVFHILGALLGGRQEFQGSADALQARRDAGLRAQAGMRQRDEESQYQRAFQAQQLDAQRANSQASRAQQDRALDLQSQRLAFQGQSVEREQAELERQRQQDALLDVADSQPSRVAQTQLQAALSALPRAQRDPILSQLGGPDGVSGLSARAIEGIIPRLPRPPQARMTGSGGGGAARGGPATPEGVTAAWGARVNAAVDAGALDREVGDALIADLSSPNPRTRSAAVSAIRHTTPTGGQLQRAVGPGEVEILPGVATTMRLSSQEAAQTRRDFSSAMSNAAALRRVQRIHERHGGLNARISPAAEAELNPELVLLRGMVADVGNTGVINPGEVPTINAALPNPSDLQQMTFSTFQARMNQWRQIVEDRVSAGLSARGVPQEGIRTAVRALWSGSFADRTAPASRGQSASQDRGAERVMVRGPDGTVRPVSAERWQRLVESGDTHGYEEVQR